MRAKTTINRTGALGLVAMLSLACLTQVAVRSEAQEAPTPVFTDWTSYTESKADGMLQDAAMSLAGEIGPATVTNGTETGFNNAAFTPPLATSDSLQVRTATAGNPYTFVFQRPVTNPVIHIGDLSGTVSFNPAVRLSRVSGDAGFTVSGSTVTGTAGANGTVVALDTYTGLAFTATSDPADVFYLQLGAVPGAVGRPPPPPDFELRRRADSTGRIFLPPGGSARVPIEVARNASSTGQVTLSGQGKHVTTSFQPAQLHGRDLERSIVTVTVNKKAKPGPRTVTIRAAPVATAGASVKTVRVPVVVQARMGAEIEGIEVTQGVQHHEFSYAGVYAGVTLAKRKKTVVRVYADYTGTNPPGGSKKRPAFGIALDGYHGNRRLSKSPIMPSYKPYPDYLSLNDDRVTPEERTSQLDPYTFVIPKAWTESNLKLVATAIGTRGPTDQESVLCLSTSCGATPSETLFSVRFADPPKASEMFLNALQQPVYHPKDRSTTYVGATAPHIYEKLVAAYPGTIWWLDPTNTGWRTPRFRAFDLATDTAILEPAIAWDKRIGKPGNGTIGAYVQGDNPGIASGRVAVASARTIAGGKMWRPTTSVAHEVFHLFGFRHATNSCKASGGESWPLADGRLGGVGLDTTPGSGGSNGPFRVIADKGPTSPAFDLMSYCGITSGGDPKAWISVYNWSRVMRRTSGAVPPISRISSRGGRATASRMGRAAAVDELAVMARGDAAGVRVTSVDRATSPAGGGSPSAYRLVGRNAAGQVQGVAPLTQDIAEGAAGAQTFALLQGQLPRAGVTRVDIVDQAGRTLATQATSAQKATARLVSPRRGSRTGRGANLNVRWRTGPGAQAFRAVLETSANGGRSFQRVWGGPNTGRAQIPIGLVRASRAARLRLRVGDGFQEAVATSGRFTLVPRRPTVRIAEPVRGQVVDAGGAVRLFGSATDDRGREIGGRRLKWTAGRTVLGRGADISAALPAGTRRVRLTATSRGRRGSASVPVRVRGSTPFFLRLRAKRRGRTAILTVSASQPARLSVRGKRYRVTTRAKRIRVRVGRKKAVKLRLVLSAGGERSTNTITVRR